MSRDLPLLSPADQIEAVPAISPARPSTGRSVYIETYGCQMNVADSELVASILGDAGFHITQQADQADILLLNTCAVRQHAEERVIGRAAQLSSLRNQRPNLTIGILGCMAQRLAETLPERAPFVDLVMGPDAYRNLPDILAASSSEALLDVRLNRTENYVGIDPVRRDGTNAWITIIRGCDKFCTFCIVPFVRGRERSIDSGEIVRQVEQIAAQGFVEITLLGQTVNSYDDGRMDFAALLGAVSDIDGIERVRFTSPYPKDFDTGAIRAIAELPQVCPSLHLPVQSGSNAQLERMRRGYTVEEFRSLVDKLRADVDGLALTTDIVVGFCGETEVDFEQTVALMEEMRFDSAFMFKYSEREGTYAHKRMQDDIPEEVKGERLQRIIQLQEQISLEVNQSLVGQTVHVLAEGPAKRPGKDGPRYYGRTDTGKNVIFRRETPANSLIDICVDRATAHTLYGDIVEAE
jgi:tRNA-2-methylthio-N6-dimethylallyladenosine synthase